MTVPHAQDSDRSHGLCHNHFSRHFTMKAIQMQGYGGVDQLWYEDVPAPTAGSGEVLVKVAATSVNPIDWKIRLGNLKGMLTLQFPRHSGARCRW